MQFQKSEWYIFLFAAFTVALIYNKAFVNIGSSLLGGANSILSKVMGQNSAGNFQAPF